MTLLAIGLMSACGFAVTKIILKITDKALKKSTADPILYTFVRNVIRVAAIIIIATMCLGALGIQIHTIIAVVGAAGAAIALALKDSLANIAGGVMIIITKPFGKDDLIDICGSDLLRVSKQYPKDQLVIGLAGSYREACLLAGEIVLDVLKKTGSTDIRAYLRDSGENILSSSTGRNN